MSVLVGRFSVNHRFHGIKISIETTYHQIWVMAQGSLDRLQSLLSNSCTPHIVASSTHWDFHHPIHM